MYKKQDFYHFVIIYELQLYFHPNSFVCHSIELLKGYKTSYFLGSKKVGHLTKS